MDKPDFNFKLKNNFKVHEFVQLAEVDYVFSTSGEDGVYLLLNVEEFGKLSDKDVQKLIDTESRVAIIHNSTLEMFTYNISEEEVTKALMEMGR